MSTILSCFLCGWKRPRTQSRLKKLASTGNERRRNEEKHFPLHPSLPSSSLLLFLLFPPPPVGYFIVCCPSPQCVSCCCCCGSFLSVRLSRSRLKKKAHQMERESKSGVTWGGNNSTLSFTPRPYSTQLRLPQTQNVSKKRGDATHSNTNNYSSIKTETRRQQHNTQHTNSTHSILLTSTHTTSDVRPHLPLHTPPSTIHPFI